MADIQITCITTIAGTTTCEGITHVGGTGWRWTAGQVIASIRAGTNTFFTRVNGRRAEVGVVDGPRGPYLRTHADRVPNDNLLALPQCPR